MSPTPAHPGAETHLALPVRGVDQDDVLRELVVRDEDMIQLVVHGFPGDLGGDTGPLWTRQGRDTVPHQPGSPAPAAGYGSQGSARCPGCWPSHSEAGPAVAPSRTCSAPGGLPACSQTCGPSSQDTIRAGCMYGQPGVWPGSRKVHPQQELAPPLPSTPTPPGGWDDKRLGLGDAPAGRQLLSEDV